MKNVSKKTKSDRTGMLQALQAEVIIDPFRGAALMELGRIASLTDNFGAGEPRIVH
ncbi:MAG: hypothetical protein GXP11_07420 [Gammaproteobacteria bacterium]|nr:hypothetical protein [Gammaproteobacteria bacterium]